MTPPTKISPNELEKKELITAASLLMAVGVLYVGSLLVRGAFVDPVSDPARFARVMATPAVTAAGLAYVLALALHLFAVFAFVQFARREAPESTRIGAFLTGLGLVLTAAVVGPFIFVHPALAKSYLEGNRGALEVVIASAGPLFTGTVMLEGIFVVVGSAFMARALHCNKLPLWICMLLAISPVLYATPIPGFVPELLGSAMLGICGAGILLAAKGS